MRRAKASFGRLARALPLVAVAVGVAGIALQGCTPAQAPRPAPVPSVAPPPATVTLNPLVRPGKYIQVLKFTSDTESAAYGEAQPVQHMEQTLEMAVDISRPDDSGRRTMHMKYRRIKITSAGVDFDSDKADGDLAGFLRPLLKADIVIKIDGSGRIDSAEGIDRVWDDWAKNNPETADYIESMKEFTGTAYLKSMLEVQYQRYPDKPVAVGDEWQPVIRTEVPLLGMVKLTQKCQLHKIDATPAGKVAVFKAASQMTSDKPPASQRGVTTATVKKVDMKQEGEVRFNLDLGLAERMTMTQAGTIDVVSTSPGGEKTPVSMTFKVKMESTMAVDTGEAAPAPAKRSPAPAVAPEEK